ncbi:hypothetical protein [Microbacterium sp. bgisy203]|uniref:hypothetical protein n=1 Tax=Microbacterium sp. bgisy203 TaxID=3413799 RepID=UPI003D716109
MDDPPSCRRSLHRTGLTLIGTLVPTSARTSAARAAGSRVPRAAASRVPRAVASRTEGEA